MKTVELYCGSEGLSFADRDKDEVILKSTWVVNSERVQPTNFKTQALLCQYQPTY